MFFVELCNLLFDFKHLEVVWVLGVVKVVQSVEFVKLLLEFISFVFRFTFFFLTVFSRLIWFLLCRLILFNFAAAGLTVSPFLSRSLFGWLLLII